MRQQADLGHDEAMPFMFSYLDASEFRKEVRVFVQELIWLDCR
jgi:hypothetical protein